MSQEKFWVLFSKKLAGEANAEELVELESLVQQHPEWQYAIQNLEDIWKHQAPEDFSEEEDAYMLHLHRMSEKNIPFGEGPVNAPVISIQRKKQKWYWVAAASVVAIAGLFVFWSTKGDKKETGEKIVQVNEVSTRMGSRSKVQLPDGSLVWLNAGSKLTYGKDYGKDTREVVLTGEAFFDVVKDKSKPFLIHASNINIKVLGTAFNVKAYPQDKQTETSLIRGSIEVTIKNRPNNKIILSPNEKLVVENEVLKLKTEKAELELQPAIAISKLHYSPVDSSVAETGWVENRLTVRDESLAELAVKMERWYDVKIEIRESSLQKKVLSVTFERETIDQALEALKESIPLRYEKEGTNIFIHR
jgi:transmembrane sensor